MILYSLRTADGAFSIAKFDADFNVESQYLIVQDPSGRWQCNCPASIRPTCRHRQMLTVMMDRADSPWFYCYEDGTWHDPLGQAEAQVEMFAPIPNEPENDGDIEDDLAVMRDGLERDEVLAHQGEAPTAVPDPQPASLTPVGLQPQQSVPAGLGSFPRRKLT